MPRESNKPRNSGIYITCAAMNAARTTKVFLPAYEHTFNRADNAKTLDVKPQDYL